MTKEVRQRIALVLFLCLNTGCGTTMNYPISDHFDGKRFFNPYGISNEKSFGALLKWQMTSEKKEWPEFVDDVVPTKPSAPKQNQYKVTFINHATTLIQIGPYNILTDPVYSERASPVGFAGPKRARSPGVKFEDLPKIDWIIVSHNHYDHLDIDTLEAIDRRDQPKILVPLGDKKILDKRSIKNVQEVDWKQTVKDGELELTFDYAIHWSSRGLFDRYHSLWGSYILKYQGSKIFFAGDTAYAQHFKEIADRHGPFDLALLPIGAYEPRWFMKEAHMNPEDAVMAYFDLNAENAIGIHFGTFQLTDEGIDDPVNDLEKAILKVLSTKHVHRLNFVAPKNGQEFVFDLKL